MSALRWWLVIYIAQIWGYFFHSLMEWLKYRNGTIYHARRKYVHQHVPKNDVLSTPWYILYRVKVYVIFYNLWVSNTYFVHIKMFTSFYHYTITRVFTIVDIVHQRCIWGIWIVESYMWNVDIKNKKLYNDLIISFIQSFFLPVPYNNGNPDRG